MPEEAIPAIAYNHPSHGGNGFRINHMHLRGLEAPQPSSLQTQPQSQPQPNVMSARQNKSGGSDFFAQFLCIKWRNNAGHAYKKKFPKK